MKIAVNETSAVLVLERENSFQLFLPGEMSYDEAPANMKMAVILCSMLYHEDKFLHSLILEKGKEYYKKYFESVIKE